MALSPDELSELAALVKPPERYWATRASLPWTGPGPGSRPQQIGVEPAARRKISELERANHNVRARPLDGRRIGPVAWQAEGDAHTRSGFVEPDPAAMRFDELAA